MSLSQMEYNTVISSRIQMAIFTSFCMEMFKVLVRGDHIFDNKQMVAQFVCGYFEEGLDPWEDPPCRHRITVDDKPVELKIYHMCLGDDYGPLIQERIGKSDGFLLTYTIDSRESFNYLKRQYHIIVDMLGTKNVPFVLCGMKCEAEDQRVISVTEGEELARDFDASFIEASAFANVRVNAIFKALVREIRKKFILKEQPAKAKKKVKKDRCALL